MVAQTEHRRQVNVVAVVNDRATAQLLESPLGDAGFSTMQASDSAAAVQMIWRHAPSLVLIDLGHCGGDGLDLCRRLRADPRSARVPIMLLSHQCDEADRVLGLELGADDFVEAPFGKREFIARVRALLRRSSPVPSEIVSRGEIVIDAGSCRAEFRGATVPLTATEFRVLLFLAQSPGRVYSREQIMEAVHIDGPDAMDRSVDPHINAIRRKLGEGKDRIETVRGFGYRLN